MVGEAHILDREHREALISAMDRYLSDEITAFALDKELMEIVEASKDCTVHFVAGQVYQCYGDFIDHKVALDKVAWDYLQRLTLLLRSD